MKNWQWLLLGGFLIFILVKALIIKPLMEKPPQTSARTITVQEEDSGEVIARDQTGREVSVNEMLQWKPEVNIE